MSDFSSKPLFPLGAVIFPGGAMKLKIFENRYRDMLGDAKKYQDRFVVSLIRKGLEVGGEAQPFDVGTLVEIQGKKRLADGSIRIIIRGLERVQLETELSESAYPMARISPYPDTNDMDEDWGLFWEAKTYCDHALLFSATMGLPTTQPLRAHDDIVEASYALADCLPAEPAFRQEILESENVQQRLSMMRDFARKTKERLVYMMREEVPWRN